MPIRDIHPGYLSTPRLLAEHRLIHRIANDLQHGRASPLAKCWASARGGLALRHALLAAELELRGHRHNSPVPFSIAETPWPSPAEPPAAQLRHLAALNESGRIPISFHAQHLWAQHKYTILARDPAAYKAFGRRLVGAHKDPHVWDTLANDLSLFLRTMPTPGGVRNAIEHMWGHVSRHATPEERQQARQSLHAMLALTQRLARRHDRYLWHSTALSEMTIWVRTLWHA